MKTLHVMHLASGSADIACDDCLFEAKRELAENDRIVGTSPLGDTGESCQWCGYDPRQDK